MNISVIGTGYVGLITAVCLANDGNRVFAIDKDFSKIKKLRQNIPTIYEENLTEELIKANESHNIEFTDNSTEAIKNSDIIFIAVGTPPKENGEVDLSFIEKVAHEIGQNLTEEREVIIITKSTVPLGTNLKVKELIKNINPTAKFQICSNPEFLREGKAIFDFKNPDRIIIGCENEKTGNIVSQLYSNFVTNSEQILITDVATAELIKYASNAFLATKVTFINEMADICHISGANIKALAQGMGLDKRIGKDFLNAGPGFGGSCFPKDTLGLAQIAKQLGLKHQINEATVKANLDRFDNLANRLVNYLTNYKNKYNLTIPQITFLGASFKAGTDDIRYSPAMIIISKILQLSANQAQYIICDPKALINTRAEIEQNDTLNKLDIKYCDNIKSTEIATTDIFVILTEWLEFKCENHLNKLASQKQKPLIVIDYRNLLDSSKLDKSIIYHSL